MTLEERRLGAGLRQVDVAKKLDVTQSAVSRWESGASIPLMKYRKRLARLYGCAVDELLEGGEDNAGA